MDTQRSFYHQVQLPGRGPVRTVMPLLFACSLFFTGCVEPRKLTDQRRLTRTQAQELDSLRALQSDLFDEIRTLRDSLQFYDDIDSGRYYRDRRRLEERIERLDYELAVCADGGLTVAMLLVDEYFTPATATLTARGEALLDDLAAKLEEDFKGRRFRIEGHADNVPVGPGLLEQFPSNWELAAARAAAVARYLMSAHELESERLEVASYGATRPTASNDTAAGRRLNRRIRVAVLPQQEEDRASEW